MKTLFRIYLLILFSLVAFSYNAYALDTNTEKTESSNPSEICSANDGSINPAYSITSREDTFSFVDNYKYVFYQSFFEGVDDPESIPYLVENNAIGGGATLVDKYTNNNDNTFTLSSKQFTCICPYGIDTFGKCNEEEQESKTQTNTDPNYVCSDGGKVANASGVLLNDDNYNLNYQAGQATVEHFGRTFSRNSDNTDIDKFLTIVDVNGSNNPKLYFNYYNWKIKHVNLVQTYGFEFKNIQCTCPEGAMGDAYGVCKPLNCNAPEIEITQGVCGTPDFCSDGAPKQFGLCDRSCEDMDLITKIVGTPDYLNPNASKMCISGIDCESEQNECITKCGSSDNIDLTSSFCNATLNTSNCTCKDSNLDDQVPDPEDIDENSTDNEISNSLLKSIKDENQKQTTLLEDYEGLLTANNESNLRKEDSLNSIDGKLSDIDNSVNGLNTGIDDINSNLDDMKSQNEEGNGWLEDIWNKLVDIYTFYTDLQNEVLTGTTNAQSKLDSDIANIETVDDLDINNTVQGYLDSVASKYTSALGISTSYGSRPSNVTVELFNKQYTIVDFSVLDEHITVIRNLFLTIAYLSGFMMLLRKA